MKRLVPILFVMVLLLVASTADAQCAMCKMAAESGTQAGNSPTLGLNQGILYLAVVPYLSFMVIAFLFWKGWKKRKREEAELGYPS
jgi:TRAP-type C4-dicarboxylate transport system permease small subunit